MSEEPYVPFPEVVGEGFTAPTDKHLQIFEFVPDHYAVQDFDIPDFGLNYKTGLTTRLHPKVLMTRGEVYRVEYYKTSTPTAAGPTYEDLVLFEDIVYMRDALGNAVMQTKTISWVCEDGTVCATTKVLVKVYTAAESIREGLRRRGNIIDYLKGETIGRLMQTELPKGTTAPEVMDMGRVFLADEVDNIFNFVDGSSPDIYTSVTADTTHTWLDNVFDGVTIRAFFLDELNIWGL